MAKLGDYISPAKNIKCGDGNYPVLSMTMHDGIVLQSERFKKSLASSDQSGYKVVAYGQLVVGFPIDEGVLYLQRTIAQGIMSPAYNVWDVDYSCVDPSYFELSLHSPQAMQYYKENLRGSTARRRSLPKEVLLELPLKMPAIDEQKRIAATIENLTHLIDTRRKQIDKIDELVKSRFVEMFGDPVSNPNSFVKKRLKDTCVIVTGNTPSRAVIEYYGDYIEWIKTDNIVQGILNPTTAVENLSEKGAEVGKIVEKNAILMACIAGSVASIGKVCITDRAVAFNQQINAILPKEYNVLFLYVLFQISNVYLVEDLNMALKGILSKSRLESKEFIVPPLDLQNQFATFVAQVDKSKLAVQKSLEQLEILKKSLMQAYFG